jgi:hypothetical protein
LATTRRPDDIATDCIHSEIAHCAITEASAAIGAVIMGAAHVIW